MKIDMLKKFVKNQALPASAFLIAVSLSSSANAATPVAAEVKNTYTKNCMANGGDKNICQCSYQQAMQTMTISDMAMFNSQMASGITNGNLAGKIETAARECASNARAASGEDTMTLPPPPPPPTPELQPVPDKQPDNIQPKNYMSNITAPTPPAPPAPLPIDNTATPGLSKTDQANMDRLNSKQAADVAPAIDEEPALAPPKAPKAPVAKTVKKTKSGKQAVFGPYDRMFFDAAARGDINALAAYATKVSDYNIKNENGDTALIVAISYGQAASVSYLISKHADVNLKNLKGQAPLHIASYIRRPDIVEALIDAKANPNVSYDAGYTPLVLATMQQDIQTIQVLLNGKAKVNQNLTEGNTELHVAAVGANPQIIQLLAQAGGKLNSKNKAGYTPLMVAAYSGNTGGVQALLALGADPRVTDKAGRTAVILAQAAGKQDVVNVLLGASQ